MNCQEFWNTMPELAEPANQRLHQHLGDCPDCAIRMARQHELTAGFRALAGDLRQLEAPSRVADRLRAAFRSQSGLQAQRPVRRWWIPVLTWASAAAAVIALAIFLVRDRQPEATGSSAPHGMELAMLELPGELPADLPVMTLPIGHFHDERFVQPGFIPLPRGEDFRQEDVNLVCRSAALFHDRAGFEVSAERAASRAG
jgi:hypothetical protein